MFVVFIASYKQKLLTFSLAAGQINIFSVASSSNISKALLDKSCSTLLMYIMLMVQ